MNTYHESSALWYREVLFVVKLFSRPIISRLPGPGSRDARENASDGATSLSLFGLHVALARSSARARRGVLCGDF